MKNNLFLNYFKEKMSVTLLPYDFKMYNEYDNNPIAEEQKPYEIHIWGLDPKSDPVLLRVQNFPYFFHVQLPVTLSRVQINWAQNYREYFSFLRDRMHDNAPDQIKFVVKGKLYYYTKKTYPFLLISFRSASQMHQCKKILESPHKLKIFNDLEPIRCKVHETEINNIRKLLTITNVGYCEWFTANGFLVPKEDRVSTINEYLVTDWLSMTTLDKEEAKKLNVYPKIFSFDIECYSPNHNKFPSEYSSKNDAYIITVVTQRFNKPETRKKYCLIFGDCYDVKDCEIIRCHSELALIKEFSKLICTLDPDIITGYNIIGFDYKYLNARLKRVNEKWPNVSRLKCEQTELKTDEWSSSGRGNISLHYLNISGRISIDLLFLIRRDYKLDKYNLETVARTFLKRGKHDIKPKEMFAIYAQYLQAKDLSATNPKHIEAKEKITKVVEYGIEDANLVMDLFEKLGIWFNQVESSNINGVTMTDLITRGQSCRMISLIYNEAFKDNIVIEKRTIEKMNYVGGYVKEPIMGFHDNVIVLDFSSLYPSLMRAYNICHTTLVPNEIKSITDDQCHIIEWDELSDPDDPGSPMIHNRYRFIKQDIRKGIIPRIVGSLVEQRSKVKEEMELTKLEVEKNILNARQLALKTTANSFYGFLGIQMENNMSLIEGAKSITAKGRETIQSVGRYLEETHGARIIYGDTDSAMVDFHITDSTKVNKMGKEIAIEVSKRFPDPLRMEFEKGMRMLCIKKKMYAAILINKQGEYLFGDNDKNILKRGIVLAKRENCRWVKNTYTDILKNILTKGTLEESIKILIQSIKDLFSGKIDWRSLVTIKELGANYKNENFAMKIFADDLALAGKPVQASERLELVICEHPEKKVLLGKKYKLVDDFEESLKTDEPLKIDKMYYLEHYMMNCVDTLMYAGHKTEFDHLISLGYGYKSRTTRHQFSTLQYPCWIIIRMMADNVDISEMLNVIKGLNKVESPKEKSPLATKKVQIHIIS